MLMFKNFQHPRVRPRIQALTEIIKRVHPQYTHFIVLFFCYKQNSRVLIIISITINNRLFLTHDSGKDTVHCLRNIGAGALGRRASASDAVCCVDKPKS